MHADPSTILLKIMGEHLSNAKALVETARVTVAVALPMDETWKVSMPKGRDPSAKI